MGTRKASTWPGAGAPIGSPDGPPRHPQPRPRTATRHHPAPLAPQRWPCHQNLRPGPLCARNLPSRPAGAPVPPSESAPLRCPAPSAGHPPHRPRPRRNALRPCGSSQSRLTPRCPGWKLPRSSSCLRGPPGRKSLTWAPSTKPGPYPRRPAPSVPSRLRGAHWLGGCPIYRMPSRRRRGPSAGRCRPSTMDPPNRRYRPEEAIRIPPSRRCTKWLPSQRGRDSMFQLFPPCGL